MRFEADAQSGIYGTCARAANALMRVNIGGVLMAPWDSRAARRDHLGSSTEASIRPVRSYDSWAVEALVLTVACLKPCSSCGSVMPHVSISRARCAENRPA